LPHAREKFLAAGRFLFVGKLGLGKTRLVRHTQSLFNEPQCVNNNWKNAAIKSAFP